MMKRSMKILWRKPIIFGTICFCSLLLVVSSPLYAQMHYYPHSNKKPPIQTLYVELAGNGILYSVNYDVIFKDNVGFRLGGSVYGFPINSYDNNNQYRYHSWQKDFTVLFMGNYYLGHGASRLQLGLGYLYGELDKSFKIQPPGLTMTIAYRLLPVHKHNFTFKFGFTPVISHNAFHPYFGIAFGFKIGKPKK